MRAAWARIQRATGEDADALAWIQHVARNALYSGNRHPHVTGRPSRQTVEFWTELLAAPDPAAVVVAEAGEEPVGVLAYGPAEEAVLELRALWVLPHLWDRGTGSRLYELFESALRDSGQPCAVVRIWAGDTRSRAFFTRRGWVADGRAEPAPSGREFVTLRLHRAG